MNPDKKYQRKRNKDQNELLKKFELPLHRSLNVAIPLQLDLLAKHRDNIEKYQQEGQWSKANAEQINASRTLKQLRCTLEDLEHLAAHLTTEQLEAFEMRTNETRERALEAIASFLETHQEVDGPISTISAEPQAEPDQEVAAPEVDVVTLKQCLILQEDNSHLTSMMTSWQRLKTDLLELRGIMHTFSNMVRSQGEQVTVIENHVEDAHDNVTDGTKQLHRAVLLKNSTIPLVGAALGGVVLGPLGLLVGMKMAATGLIGGGAMGYFGGRFWREKKLSYLNEIEMEQLDDPSTASEDKKDL